MRNSVGGLGGKKLIVLFQSWGMWLVLEVKESGGDMLS